MKKTKESKYEYTGEHQPPQSGDEDTKGQRYFPYIPSDDLKEAVNLAIALERPLLLEGEPGCGKTRLAAALVYEFSMQYQQEQRNKDGKFIPWTYYTWTVKSTTRARDGLYHYDAVARLRDAQLIGSNPEQLQEYLGKQECERLKRRLLNKKNYREFGPLGEALRNNPHRPVLLIDEIDKADSDFPNDLLLELEEQRFEVPETGESIPTPTHKPIIIITSNREKPLPDPFLRRCLYFFVEFPDEERLWTIIDRRFGQLQGTKEQLVSQAVERFYEIRDLLHDRPGSRPPGTSECLEFLTALLTKAENFSVDAAMKDLQNLSKRLPLLGTLLKTRADQELYRED